jgi:hypothetical protein
LVFQSIVHSLDELGPFHRLNPLIHLSALDLRNGDIHSFIGTEESSSDLGCSSLILVKKSTPDIPGLFGFSPVGSFLYPALAETRFPQVQFLVMQTA